MMKFSIVTISFNQREFLERCLLSVIEQDYDDIEYIVVDPGSTDGSREIIEKYRDRIDKIIFEPDDGPAEGLNNGFACATGDIFGFLNSDDLLIPGALNEVAIFFSENHGTDIVSGHSTIIDKNGIEINKMFSDNFSLIRYVYQASYISQPSTFFRATAFHGTDGFNESNKITWDAELWVSLAINGASFAVIDRILSCSSVYMETISSLKHRGIEGSKYRKMIFFKVMGRNRTLWDALLRFGFRVLRYFLNPKLFYQRLTKGPISLPSRGNSIG